jgi:phenylalanyl-tRNA synthetase beta chain
MGVMRSSLLGNLLQVVKFNTDRKASRVRVFEVGRVFHKDASVQASDTTVAGFHQPLRVAGMAYGPAQPAQWGVPERAVDFYDIKADVEALMAPAVLRFEPAEHPAMHPGRCARVWQGEQAIGFVGELHPRWRQAWDLPQAPVMFELEMSAVLQRDVPSFAGVSRHQAVERDLALWVAEEVTHAALMQAIWAAPTQGLLRDALLFDVYRPNAKAGEPAVRDKSLAVRLTLNSDEATLTEAQIEAAVAAVVLQLQTSLSARLRG